MENVDNSTDDLSRSKNGEAPVDPSNTSQIGQNVEQGVISKKEGISQQSAEWEDRQETKIPNSLPSENASEYIKNPSPESMNHGDEVN